MQLINRGVLPLHVVGFALSLLWLWPHGGAAQTADPGAAARTREGLIIEASKQKMLGNRVKAAAIYASLLEQEPNYPLAAYELSRLELIAETYEEALAHAQVAATSEPTNPWYRQHLAEVFTKMGRWEEAAKVYGDLAAQFPTHSSYRERQLALLRQAKAYPAALKILDEQERLQGLQPGLIDAKVEILLAAGEGKRAIKERQRLCAAFPQTVAYWRQLADLQQKLGDPAGAKGSFTQILQLDPNDPGARLALAAGASTGLAATLADPAIPLSQKLEQIQPWVEKLSRADTVALPELRTLIAALRQAHPAAYPVLVLQGKVALRAGQSAAAADFFAAALKQDDTEMAVWELALQALQQQGNCQQLARLANQAIELFPNRLSFYQQAAWAALLSYDPAGASDWLEQALPIAGREVASRQLLLVMRALAEALGGAAAASKTTLAAANALGPLAPAAKAWQALAATVLTPLDASAAAGAEQALSALPLLQEAHLALARFALLQADYRAASNRLEPLLLRATPWTVETYGDILFKTGQVDEAVKQWRLAQAQGSKNPLLAKKIADKQLYE